MILVISTFKIEMFFKCPKCQDRAVVEEELGYLRWRRVCEACGFVYTLEGREAGYLDAELQRLVELQNDRVPALDF